MTHQRMLASAGTNVSHHQSGMTSVKALSITTFQHHAPGNLPQAAPR